MVDDGEAAGMRWDDLFADLEGELEALERAELAGEVADRTRREQALLSLVDRLRTASGALVTVRSLGGHATTGRVREVGPDWLLLVQPAGHQQALLATGAVVTVTGLGAATATPGWEGEVARRLDLRWALRGLARSRTGVRLLLGDGSTLAGTLDRVGRDHVELAEHPPGELRRARAVRAVVTVPLTALSVVLSEPA